MHSKNHLQKSKLADITTTTMTFFFGSNVFFLLIWTWAILWLHLCFGKMVLSHLHLISILKNKTISFLYEQRNELLTPFVTERAVIRERQGDETSYSLKIRIQLKLPAPRRQSPDVLRSILSRVDLSAEKKTSVKFILLCSYIKPKDTV